MCAMESVEFLADLSSSTQSLLHAWEFAVGSGHAPLALRTDWQTQLLRCHDELGMQRVRFHGILSDDMGTLIDRKGQLLYSFFNIDRIWDFLVSNGMSPIVELSFMPRVLSSGSKTVFHYVANVTPPKDYGQWAILIRKLVKHAVERYGIGEVASWLFEVWNEPNLDAFWTGTQSDYFNLYRHTVGAIKEVDQQLQVGGPATANDGWIEEFVDFCEKEHLAVDFISTHHYPTDLRDNLTNALGDEDQDTESVLAATPRGALREYALQAQRQTRGHPLVYTEWNSSSNPRDPLHDESYAAAYAVKTMLEGAFVRGYSFWTFSDIFEENYFPSRPFHGGFGLLNLHGIAKPVYRAFQLLHEFGHEQYSVDGTHPTLDAWIARDLDRLTVLLNNHAMPRNPIEPVHAKMTLIHCGRPLSASIRRIDALHANPKQRWQEWGEPEYLTADEVDRLHACSEMESQAQSLDFNDETIAFEVDVPPHAVAAITIELSPQ